MGSIQEKTIRELDTTKVPPSFQSTSSPEDGLIVVGGKADPTAIPSNLVTNKWQQMANKLISLIGAEARGVERVDESLRLPRTTLRHYHEMTMIWFSINLTANILTIGVLGPVAFGLGTLDSMM